MFSQFKTVLSEELKLTKDLAVGNTTIETATGVSQEWIQNSSQETRKLKRKLVEAMEEIGKEKETRGVKESHFPLFARWFLAH